MATHDYIISNASGAAVRADLNNALAAIATNNSSATAPTTTYAYQWWADTGSSPTVMKLRNAANSAWITLFQLDGEWTNIAFENGTAAAPSIYFKDSGTDTGLFSGGTDQVNITTGGTERVEWGTSEVVFNDSGANYDFRIEGDTNANLFFVDASADAVGIGTAAPVAALHSRIDNAGSGSTPLLIQNRSISSNTAVGISFAPNTSDTADRSAIIYGVNSSGGSGNGTDLTFHTNSNGGSPSEKARIDSSGRLLVGTSSSPSSGFGQYAKLVVQGQPADATGGGNFSIQRGEAAAGGNITSGEGIGNISWNDNAGNTFGLISCEADANAGTNDYPGRLVFSTTADGASSPTERMRIDKDGQISWGPLSGGNFPNYLASGGTIRSTATYNTTTANAANVNISTAGEFFRSTSSIKYKKDVETIGETYSEALLQCRPVWYRSTSKGDNPEWGYWGFIAEEVAEIDPRLCFFKEEEDGTLEPEGVQYDRFVPHLLNLIKRQGEAIAELQAEIAALKTQ
jgi:hypothetical protein